MLYQLSYEAIDVGSRSVVGSYVPVKEMSVNDIWNKSYMNCGNENEEMIVSVNAIYAIAERSLKKKNIQDFNGVCRFTMCVNKYSAKDSVYLVFARS